MQESFVTSIEDIEVRIGNDSTTSFEDASSKNERCIRQGQVFPVYDFTTFECPYPGIAGNIVTVQLHGQATVTDIEVQLFSKFTCHIISLFVLYLKFIHQIVLMVLSILTINVFKS